MLETKKRGRPATGRYPMIGIRVSPALRDAISQWAKSQPEEITFSQAARHLIELGLARTRNDPLLHLFTGRPGRLEASE